MRHAGFYKLIQQYPSPVLPIYQDQKGTNFHQVVDRNGKISNFEPLDLDYSGQDRFLYSEEFTVSDKLIGDPAIICVALTEDHVVSGTPEFIASTMSERLLSGEFEKSPFFGLDVALLIGNPELISRATFKCVAKLATVSKDAARQWALAAPISEEVRSAALNALIKSDERIVSRLYYEGSKFLMRALSLFARDELHMYRSMMVDRLLNKSSIEDFGDNFHGAMSVLDRISDRGANASATEAYLLRYPSTGGYIDTDINIKKFAQAVANKSSQKIYNNEKFHRYLKMSLVRPNRNFFVLLIIIDAVVKHYPNFANFVHSSDLDYILDQEDMRMATNIMTSYPELMRGFSGED